ncbi:TM0106 family RecB-like putative nuclease [Leucobacter sp. USHLN153]|uniref:TM0106 family RecB-like putative nuclease n=1 Tax=Leucobacter sp. USHLN153 TaxID=3081268 RepID=UPI00301A5DC4
MFLQDVAEISGGREEAPSSDAGTCEPRLRVVTSASDLTAASQCEFAFLRRFDAKLGRDVDVPPDDDPMLARAARLGDAHEDRVLEEYVANLGEGTAGEPGGVVSIERPQSMSAEDLSAVAFDTVTALTGGAEVVFQATFFDPAQRAGTGNDPEIGFVGFADFLRRTPEGMYEVQDTKLARRAKVTALMQLAAYAEQLERVGVPVSDSAVLILGDGAVSRHRIADIAPVFRSRRRRMHALLTARYRAVGVDGSRQSAPAVAWGAPDVAACGRCEVCAQEVERTRDPLLIAGIRGSQRDALIGAGFTTIEAVAGLSGFGRDWVRLESLPQVPGIAPAVLHRLADQAWLQSAASQMKNGAPPPFLVTDAAALAAIPEPCEGDLFFDFEGDPLYREAGADDSARWGIDYLFGMVDREEQFSALWAHDLDAERVALEEFLALVSERRRAFPDMRIYHYAAYERTHLASIAARHGVGEAEVDELFREHVLVDLYPIVRAALRVGSRSYSIKKLEPLYMGDGLRDEEGVTSAAQSVTEYADASALLASADSADREEGQRRLDAIADYNRYDCVSTLRLRDWLLDIAMSHGVTPYQPAERAPEGGPELELSAVSRELATHAAALAADGHHDDRAAVAIASSAVDYHEREQKSFWWAHFARLIDPIEDWADMRDVLVTDPASSRVEETWHLPHRARVERRHVRLGGAAAPGSKFRDGGDVFAVYAHPAPFPQYGAAPGSRGARQAKILEGRDDGATIQESLPQGVEPFDELPVALTPGPPPRAGAQKGAIEEWGSTLARALDAGDFPSDAVVDLLRRREPRLAGGGGLVSPDSEDALREVGGDFEMGRIGAVIASLVRLDRSALAVQGPPGTGKTYLAARVIRRLVEHYGWKIGVVAQSHRVVENVLEGVVRAGLDPALVGKAAQRGAPPEDVAAAPYTVLPNAGQSAFLAGHQRACRGAVIGGTAWDFSNPERVARQQLDLLVVDEAGQFSLAPTIAAAVSASRLLLLGDPQQLPQVSQGTHPEPVDTSALGWLLGEHGTMPPSLGYFLTETRRMRPELADVVSELSYEGRLRAHPSTAGREVLGAGEPGLHWHPVTHAGNSTSSEAEAERVVEIVKGALAGRLREPGVPERPLEPDDLIVVAPYNAQVECVAAALRRAGFDTVRVGTVDKFQGQEAVLAIVTLAASSAADVPRGVEFLLMRNRLNVAISRAQWAAHLVSSDRLGDGLPTSAEGLAALSGYLRLVERAHIANVEAW